jgi:hypothetical protein
MPQAPRPSPGISSKTTDGRTGLQLADVLSRFAMRALPVLLGLLLAQVAHAAPGSFRLPAKKSTPLDPGALITLTVTDKQQTYERGFLDQNQYQQIRDGALRLIKRFPPKRYFYVTIGRSPTPVAAFLDNLGPDGDVHVNVPASNLREGQVEGFEKAWFKHLDHFLPAHLLKGKQKIVLVDRSTTGATLTKVKQIFEQYLQHKGVEKSVRVVAFARRKVKIRSIDINDAPELVAMNAGTYDKLAKYPYFYVGETAPEKAAARPAYDKFKQQMAERMSRDEALPEAMNRYLVGAEGDK